MEAAPGHLEGQHRVDDKNKSLKNVTLTEAHILQQGSSLSFGHPSLLVSYVKFLPRQACYGQSRVRRVAGKKEKLGRGMREQKKITPRVRHGVKLSFAAATRLHT